MPPKNGLKERNTTFSQMQFDNRNRNRLTTLSHRSTGMGFRGLGPDAPFLEGFTAAKIAKDLSSLHNSHRNFVGLRERKSLFASAGALSFKVLDALRNDQNEVAVQEGRNLIRQSGAHYGAGEWLWPRCERFVIPDEANPDESTENAENACKLIEGISDTIIGWERL